MAEGPHSSRDRELADSSAVNASTEKLSADALRTPLGNKVVAPQVHRVADMQERIGEERFVLDGLLGSGGMGAVYRAYDKVRQEHVALKTMDNIDPASVWHFKQEFRALSDVSHPNIVSLYELISVNNLWFFTMELIEGTDFLTYVRQGGRNEPGLAHANISRLRPALLQLAVAIQRLHNSGHIHRDIKPSNIIVGVSGRVVVIDFGVILEVSNSPKNTGPNERPGTPAYMAPELVLGPTNIATMASDWYSFGVVLYLSISGTLPISDRSHLHHLADTNSEPRPLSELSDASPEDLTTLCAELLCWQVKDRPLGQEIIDRLSVDLASTAHLTPVPVANEDLLVGRSKELQTLYSSLKEAKAGRGVLIRVSGSSGMGKSVLLRHFLSEAQNRSPILVFSGRCYERESVPYKSLDSVLDSITQFLLGQSDELVQSLLPDDMLALLTAFPALRRVPAIHRTVSPSERLQSSFDLQRRVFGALRNLLSNLSRQQLVVIYIDDLQWGDIDSVPFLADLARQIEFPLLFLCSYRSEAVDSSEVLQTLFGSIDIDRDDSLRTACSIVLGAIPTPKLKTLALSLLPPQSDPELASRIASEAKGNPYFVHEMVRYAAVNAASDQALQIMSLNAVIAARIAELSTAARDILSIVSLSSWRISQGMAVTAAQIGNDRRRRALLELRAGLFVRTTGIGKDDTIEPYHDRVREVAVTSLGEERERVLHLSLAQELDSHARVRFSFCLSTSLFPRAFGQVC